MEYNFLFQHPYDPQFQCGSLYNAEKRGLGIVTMRTVTSGIFQRWINMVNPENTFNYNPALIQFVLSNPIVDVALLGMRTKEEVIENTAVCENMQGRIVLDKMHTHFVK
jgi:predicted aldo/keto reductase-like oxidoreductase